jgi:Transmembrane exosortase (Exosortase_EpsH)
LYTVRSRPLQLRASKLAVGILDLLHVPSVCEGNVIYLAHFTAGVAGACTGIPLNHVHVRLRSADMSSRSPSLLTIASAPTALSMNATRIAGTGLVGNY